MIEITCKAYPGPWFIPTSDINTDDIIRGRDGIRLAGSCCCGGFVRPDDAKFVEMARTQLPKLLEFVGKAEHAAQQLQCICATEKGRPCVRCWIERAKVELESGEVTADNT